jgi:nitrite reductase (NADH) large subunit
MAEIAAEQILARRCPVPGADMSTKLAAGRRCRQLRRRWPPRPVPSRSHSDPVAGTYKKLVVADDMRTLLGGILVGDAEAYATLKPLVGREIPADPR